MGKQYISTASTSLAHKSDILGLEICKKYTVTAGSDGYIKLWNNDIQDLGQPRDSVVEKFVSAKGLHHLAVLEDVVDAETFCVVAATAFDGVVHFYRIIEGSFVQLEMGCGAGNYAIAFLKSSDGSGHKFVATEANGAAKVYGLSFEAGVTMELQGKLESKTQSFATAVAVGEKWAAVGHQSGDVHVFDLETLKPLYSFLGFGMKSASTTVRAIQFSPVGKLLAVARDSGSFGTITLYDTYYGETIGSFSAASHSSQMGVGGHAHEGWCFSLDFNEDGTLLVSGGYDKLLRVWDVETRQREATITVSKSDFTDVAEGAEEDDLDDSVVTAVRFVKKGLRSRSVGADKNEGLCCVSFDKGVRWYREAGGV